MKQNCPYPSGTPEYRRWYYLNVEKPEREAQRRRNKMLKLTKNK